MLNWNDLSKGSTEVSYCSTPKLDWDITGGKQTTKHKHYLEENLKNQKVAIIGELKPHNFLK